MATPKIRMVLRSQKTKIRMLCRGQKTNIWNSISRTTFYTNIGMDWLAGPLQICPNISKDCWTVSGLCVSLGNANSKNVISRTSSWRRVANDILNCAWWRNLDVTEPIGIFGNHFKHMKSGLHFLLCLFSNSQIQILPMKPLKPQFGDHVGNIISRTTSKQSMSRPRSHRGTFKDAASRTQIQERNCKKATSKHMPSQGHDFGERIQERFQKQQFVGGTPWTCWLF